MIVSENVKIHTTLPTTNEIIEKELKQKGIKPLRWAIIEADKQELTISVSYEKLC